MSGDQLQPEDTLDDRGRRGRARRGVLPARARARPPQAPRGRRGLETRLDEEEPEVWDQVEQERDADIVDGDVGGEVGDERTGRLGSQTDVGADGEIQQDGFAEDEGIDGAGASAEEAAMHTIDDV